MINWIALFTGINIPHKTSGKNVSAGNVNICCPFCVDDPSYHMSVSLQGKGYICYRNPIQHRGRNPATLLYALGQHKNDIEVLLRLYGGETIIEPVAVTENIAEKNRTLQQINKTWDLFEPAVYKRRAVEYLKWRGFDDPEQVIRRFDLRYAPDGHWANRLLIPYYWHGNVIAWTGRDIVGRSPIKYLTSKQHAGGLLFVPGKTIPHHNRSILLEGPLDAIKVACACDGTGFYPAAISGKSITHEKLNMLLDITSNTVETLLSMDNDVPFSQLLAIKRQLKPWINIRLYAIPDFYKDCGEMYIPNITTWLKTATGDID
jgi:hypothetical protein